MAKLNQDIPDEMLNKFYTLAIATFGNKKGCKKKALIQAIEEWMKKQNKR